MPPKNVQLAPFVVALLFSFGNAVHGSEVRIKSVYEFINFKNNVNKGNKYSGTTVFLDSDLDFAGKTFDPIGDYSNRFCGAFDGQGHVISNLEITSSSENYVGLFGYSHGLTIKNVILDSSCSITSSFSGSNDAYVGGIIGYCKAENGPCIIENSVNMGSVTFSGTIQNHYLYLGGIAGDLYSGGYDSIVKNCANYGDVTHSGTSKHSYIGGIIGEPSGSSSNRVYIYNCLNHGTITHSDNTNYLYLGGIAERTPYTSIENCVSAGKISSTKTNYIGSIVGYVSSYTIINYCYFTSKLSGYNKYGSGTPSSESNIFSYDSTTFKLNETASIGSYTGNSLIGALNSASDYYILRDYSHWLLNKDKKAVSFTINKRTNPIKMDYQIILLPSLASEGNMSFDGWYEDSAYSKLLTSYEATSDTELYGKFEENTNNYTIAFDTRREEVFVAPITASFGSVVQLPSDLNSSSGCPLAFWETENGENVESKFTIPSHNITLYAVWKCTRIKATDDFIDFSKIVNNGVDYSETTVFLDSDIDFTGKTFEPIGKDWDNYFLSVFDGQGHVISNLKITSSSRYVGLFGYSEGLTIRNVILDSSCSITNSYVGSGNVHVGGIIGDCYEENGKCIIENSVNMGSVSFNGTISGYYDLYLGGIAGYLYSPYYDSTVKNCANYGDVTHSGACSGYSYIGGIAGIFGGSSSNRVYIYNCLNHGTITHSDNTNYLYLGGIAGRTPYTSIENCVSAGKISSTKTNYIGSIVGCAESGTSINYCYYTSDVGISKIIGTGSATRSNTPTSPSNPATILNKVNRAVKGWNKWLLNQRKSPISFKINDNKGFTLSTQFILFPDINTIGSNTFSGWYKSTEYNELFQSTSVTAAASFYGLYGIIRTVAFNPNSGSSVSFSSKKVVYGCKYETLPRAIKTYYTLTGWFTEKDGGEEVTSESKVKIVNNHTLYAHWTINQYTITFEVDGGNECKPITQDYNTEIVLPEPTKTGYTFDCWCSDPELRNEYSETTMPAEDVTLYAKWSINQYNITFIFNNGEENEVRTLDFNEEIIYPEGVKKAGYTFGGWDNKPDRMPAENITVTAQWTANKYTVTFDVNGGNALSETESKKEVTYDSPYGDLPEATRTGYTFAGWFTEETFINKVASESTVSTPNDHILYAHWTINQYTITFEVEDGSEYENITQDYNTEVELPEPTKTGYTFDCWCSDSELSRVYTETTMPAGNVTLYAKWNINQYTLTFDFKNGAGDEVRTLDFNEEIVYPENVEKTGYTFNGWDNKPDRMPAENITITSLWTINQYTLTIIFNNGTEPEVRIINYNSTIGYPTEPVKEGHTFNGWSHTTEFMPAHNLTITALWTANKYIITFVFDNGNEPEKRTFDYNSTIAYPENVTKEGYVFDKWDSNITVMPSHDLTITAQWMGCMVTIVFDTKEFKEAEVEDKIREIIGGSENVIIEFVTDEESGSVVCIIKFVDQISSESISTIMENITSNEGLKHIINYVEVDGEEWASKDNTVLTVVIVAVVVVVISVLLAVPEVLLIWRRRAAEKAKAQRGAINRVVEGRADAVDSSKFKSRFRKSKKIYPKKYDGPTGIVDALMSAGVDRESAVEASEECKRSAEVSCENGYIAGDFTLDDAAAVCLYTFDFGDDRYDINPYRLLNKALRADKHKIEEIVKVRDVLYLIMTALRKLPVVSGVTLYRGIRSKVDVRQYKEGSTIVLPGFSSTSPDLNTTKAFLNTVADENEKKKRRNEGTGSENGSDEEIEMTENPNGEEEDVNEENSGGTLFIIEDGWGYNVQPYSQFPEEEEILLEPEREFEVMSVTESENLVLVTLKMRKTKPILTKVFGKRRIYKQN